MIEARCRQCRKNFKLDVTDAQYDLWKAGALIQKAMPNLDASERELLISGTCGACFDDLFKVEA